MQINQFTLWFSNQRETSKLLSVHVDKTILQALGKLEHIYQKFLSRFPHAVPFYQQNDKLNTTITILSFPGCLRVNGNMFSYVLRTVDACESLPTRLAWFPFKFHLNYFDAYPQRRNSSLDLFFFLYNRFRRDHSKNKE